MPNEALACTVYSRPVYKSRVSQPECLGTNIFMCVFYICFMNLSVWIASAFLGSEPMATWFDLDL